MAKSKKKSSAKTPSKIKAKIKAKPKTTGKVAVQKSKSAKTAKTVKNKAKTAVKKATTSKQTKNTKKPSTKKEASHQKAEKKIRQSSTHSSHQLFPFVHLQEARGLNETRKKLTQFVTPLDDRLLVEVSLEPTKTPGGLFLPVSSESSAQSRGRVLSVGRGHVDAKGRLRPMDTKVGDEVVFPKYAGTSLIFDNQELWFLREGDLLGIVEKE